MELVYATSFSSWVTYTMATQEERDARATLERLTTKVDALIVQMESTLASDPVPMSALRRRITNAQKVWSKFEGQYDQLRAIAGENQAEQDRTQHVNLQHRYLDLHALAEDALNDDQDTEDICPKELTSGQKVQQYSAKWKAVHHRIDMALDEIKTSLEGTAIDSLEVLKVKEDQLARVHESLKESASLVDSITTEDPEQTEVMTDSEATKSVQAVSKISACEV